jgi:hypothetical protein
MQGWSKFQTTNLNFILETPSNEILFIRDALMSTELNTIRVTILDIRASDSFEKQGVTRTSTFVLIGDQTGTTYLTTTDLPTDILKIENTFDITKVRKKNFNGSYILSTTIDTRISLSNLVKKIYSVEFCLNTTKLFIYLFRKSLLMLMV